MHPILLRIPLPKGPLKLWWAAAAVAVIVALYGAFMLWRRQAKGEAYWSFAIAIGLGIAGYVYRASTYEAENVPIYSYGVMLGVSLIVGWYITLPLAKRDGLPAETMANCYVVTALAALVGSRLLYIWTNPTEFPNFDMATYMQIRKGGLVAYGGFVGGFLGSWAYLRARHIRLMPWADVAVPSLASGLFITRIGCYLYGCDFGKRLTEKAPGFLKTIGTFPKLPDGTLGYADNGLPIIGSPAYARHLTLCQEGTFHGPECRDLHASLPVHPTQLYESLIGLGLLIFLLWFRKRQVFRGQIFFLFTFAYGILRFMLELLRDDVERGEVPPAMGEHILMAGSLFIFAVAFAYGPALSIANERLRTVARIGAFVPAIALYLALRPATFGTIQIVKLSTSQAIGLFSACAVSFFYARYWLESKRNPEAAMDLGLPEEEKKPRRKKKRRKPSAAAAATKPVEEAPEES
jgi:phosphatidylglycerol:prolipoprotein diacylglycerol transferase